MIFAADQTDRVRVLIATCWKPLAAVKALAADLSATKAARAACPMKQADHAADRVRTAPDAVNRVLARPLLPADDSATGGDGRVTGAV